MKIVARAALVLFLIVDSGEASSEKMVRGLVTDSSGKPVADADVTASWRANGPLKDENGKPYDLTTVQGQKAFWGSEGKMFPLGANAVRTGPDGRFTISVSDNRHHLMAMDKTRLRGALAILPNDDVPEIEMRLAPLVRVKGRLEGPESGKRPEWCHAETLVPDDPTRPLDLSRLVGCGSFEARFEMSLPPGRYALRAYTLRDEDDELSEMIPNKDIVLTGNVSEVDLGVLHLSPFRPTLSTKIKRSKADGRWNDYTDHFGEKPPEWNVVDARGVKKDIRLSDFRGKWVLVDFWGLTCIPCLREGIPNLIKFYEEHQSRRDRFEILSICIDVDGNLKSIADLDKQLEPIVKHVWKKPLPFPVLLDPTFKTWERYGLPGLGTVILIDPEGNLVEGDAAVLAERLRHP